MLELVVFLTLQVCSASSTMDKPDVSGVCDFDKTKLKKTETCEKNPLPTKESELLHKAIRGCMFCFLVQDTSQNMLAIGDTTHLHLLG